MVKIKIEKQIKCTVDSLWELFSDVTRSDWVPFANKILYEDGVRTFIMEGVGEIKEKIIEINHSEKSLTYKVVQSPVPLDHHLAKVTILEDKNFSKLIWVSEIKPDKFEKLIKDGMESSIEMIQKILE
jgi:hypothetical protein|tara:strand:- start:3404 stop:3787 length:384 start_codon:yes stop_codon:yes gene_type:complete